MKRVYGANGKASVQMVGKDRRLVIKPRKDMIELRRHITNKMGSVFVSVFSYFCCVCDKFVSYL